MPDIKLFQFGKRRGKGVAAGFVLLALLLLGRRWLTDGPHYLRDIHGTLLAVGAGMLLRVEHSPSGETQLHLERVTDGKNRFTRTLRLPDAEVCAGSISADTVAFLVRKTLPAEPGSPHSPATSREVEFHYTLHLISLDGRMRATREFQGCYPTLLTSDGCYWWKGRAVGGAELMYAGYRDANPMVVLRGRMGSLRAASEAVFVEMPVKAESSSQFDLITLAPGAGKMEQFLDFPLPSGSVAGAERGIAYLKGRLFWTDAVQVSGGVKYTERQGRLISARPDGRDRKVHLQSPGPDGRSFTLTIIGTDRGRLLVASAVQAAQPSGREAGPPPIDLLVADPARPEVLRRLNRVPKGWSSGCYVDGPSVYFPVRVRRENWLDWSAQGLQPPEVTAWYRAPRPE